MKTTESDNAMGAFRARPPRTQQAQRIKGSGIHYTPPELADFLAGHGLGAASLRGRALRVLDPACGDGELLAAVGRQAADQIVELHGMDTDPDAVRRGELRLAEACPGVATTLRYANFLDEVVSLTAQPDLFGSPRTDLGAAFDLVIANPPYVRTQVLGAETAQQLADRFGLSGRVDLYQAFVVGITEVLREGGVLALLCSNRFMTTKSGRDLRRLLASNFEIEHLFDLGDTKLFAAAVLPAVVVARKCSAGSVSFPITSIYEASSPHPEATHYGAVCDALEASEGAESVVIGGKVFSVRRGAIQPTGWDQPWVAMSTGDSSFIEQLAAWTRHRFKDVTKVRVGIKSTCDRVFVRDDWAEVEDAVRPEPDVLLPLLTHKIAAPWRARDSQHQVLYPYDLTSERRCPLDLDPLPRTRAYFESHRAELEARSYVVNGGRHWWEIWVPQRPALWKRPKIVFPDISEVPKFWLDVTGAVVNGDCYWMTVPSGEDDELGRLMLAVANSTLATRFYDHACGNKLYAGRRRYITQYVEEFPLPDPGSAEAQKAIRAVEALVSDEPPADADEVADEIDFLVWRSFGFEEPAG